ncbi:MAG TPA: hypothetical protein VFP52_09380 [Myxococcales bacterium]|nr:hypothetical protein [Myxococcales bacterium]HET9753163.1 hypothetical protein [Myxococcales bacterium]
MTPLGKTIFAALSLALLLGGTLALRRERKPEVQPAQVAPAQVAQAPETPLEPPKTISAPDAGMGEQEPLPEDGSGS